MLKDISRLAANNNLPLNVLWARRHLNRNSTCSLCDEVEESSIHALKDFLHANQVWHV